MVSRKSVEREKESKEIIDGNDMVKEQRAYGKEIKARI